MKNITTVLDKVFFKGTYGSLFNPPLASLHSVSRMKVNYSVV